MVLSGVLPLVVAPLSCLPALRRLPGQTAAHEARWPALGTRAMSVPISARIAAAVTGPLAGKLSSTWTAAGPAHSCPPRGRKSPPPWDGSLPPGSRGDPAVPPEAAAAALGRAPPGPAAGRAVARATAPWRGRLRPRDQPPLPRRPGA